MQISDEATLSGLLVGLAEDLRGYASQLEGPEGRLLDADEVDHLRRVARTTFAGLGFPADAVRLGRYAWPSVPIVPVRTEAEFQGWREEAERWWPGWLEELVDTDEAQRRLYEATRPDYRDPAYD
jgi:hypothetical protein